MNTWLLPNLNVGFNGCFQEKCLETANIAVLFINIAVLLILFGNFL